jgi:hypothetical protein
MDYVSVKELREYLIPKLFAFELECKRCNKLREEIQQWLDVKLQIEQEKHDT